VVVFGGLLLQDDGAFTTLQAIYKLTTWGEMLGFIAGALLLFGAGPTIVIGAVLILVRRSSPILLVATPATLFLFTLIEVVRERNDASFAVQLLPAMVAGGALMFVMLSRPVAEPPEKVFE
jgi:predicted neutral ceramidase superfamily lipid hydrolase